MLDREVNKLYLQPDVTLLALRPHETAIHGTRNCTAVFVNQLSLKYRSCGIVVRVSGFRSRGPGFDSQPYQIF
jgi:hypothetical protein